MDEEPQHEEELPAPPEVESEAPPSEPLTPPSGVSVRVSVQVGQLKMSAEQLLGLQPGNTLEMAGERIELAVDGKRFARGELIRIGDAMGVRILELG